MRTQQTTPADIIEMAECITPEDHLEATCGGMTDIVWDLLEYLRKAQAKPEEVTMRSLWSKSGDLLLIGGWTSTGHVWMFSTVHAKDHPVETLRGVLECREEALAQCPRLYNMMMRSNKAHVKLLENIGAVFTGAIYGLNGEPFQAFYIDKEVA